MKTLIHDIIDLLQKEELTAKEICYKLDIDPKREKEIYEVLKKVAKVMRKKGRTLMMSPPRCRKCGFEMSKLRAGRCPKCKSEWIEPARFKIE